MNETQINITIELFKLFENEEKVIAWLNTKNLSFGGASPQDLLLDHKEDKVLAYIQANLVRHQFKN